MTFLLSGALAHLVADFVLQSEAIAKAKAILAPKAHLVHGVSVLISFVLTLHIYGILGLSAAITIAVFHTVFDYLKCLANRNLGARQRLLVFVLDQLAHLGAIVIAWELTQPTPSAKVVSFYSRWLAPKTLALLRTHAGLTLNRVLAVLVTYVFTVFGGAVLVRLILDGFEIAPDPEVDTRSGRYIGMLERTLMVTLVVSDALPSIAFVIAAKALARFRQLAEFRFGEYYLIGTLSSTLIAVATGAALRTLLPAL